MSGFDDWFNNLLEKDKQFAKDYNKARARLLKKNFLGKSGFQSWPEFLSGEWNSLICRVIGHSKTCEYHLHDTLCARCRVVLKSR